MKPTTIRLPEEVLEELDAEADEHDFHTRTEYLRYLIDHRELVISIALEQRRTRMDMLEDKLGEIEERLHSLEEDVAQQPRGAVEEPASGPEPEDEGTTTGDSPPQIEGESGELEPETLEPIPDIDEEGAETTEPLDLRDPGPDDVEDRVRGLDFFAPTREIRANREQAVVAAWETLAEYGELTRDDFAELVFENHTAAFSSFEGWYDRLIVPALDQLVDIERADEDTWRYVEEGGSED